MKFEDQLGRQVELSSPPRRIVSLVPSQSELLSFLGLDDQIVGITAYCVQPPHLLAEKTVVGGTKNFDPQKILALQPDLIIANKEENPRELIEALESHSTVWVSDVKTLDAALEMIRGIGQICRREAEANALIEVIERQWQKLPRLHPRPRFLYLIWNDPLMAASADTYVSDLLERAGFENACPTDEARYPVIKPGFWSENRVDIVFLSSEPYSFSTKELHKLSDKYDIKDIRIVDGQNFIWYGSRIIRSISTIDRIIHKLNLKNS